MFNSLRDELNKIALMESDDLEYFNDHTVDGDEGAADDELYDDIEEGEEEEDFDDLDGEAVNEAIDAIVNQMLVNEALEDADYEEDYDYDADDDEGYYEEEYDEYEDYYDEEEAYGDDVFDDDYDDDEFDDDDDEVDMDEGVVGDGKTVKGDPSDDEYDSVDIGGVTNSIHYDLKEDIEDDEEDDLDELLEAMLNESDDTNDLRATSNDIFGDSADMPSQDTPPSPQYSKVTGRCGRTGATVPTTVMGDGQFGTYGKSKFSRDVLGQATVDDDAYDEEGNSYDLYASAGNIYDDDENEEYYGLRNKVQTKNLFGRHNINNINYAELGDRFAGTKDALDESVELFLRGLE